LQEDLNYSKEGLTQRTQSLEEHKGEEKGFCPLSYREAQKKLSDKNPLFPLCVLCSFVIFVRNLCVLII